MSTEKHKSRIKTLGVFNYFGLLLWAPMLFVSLMVFDAPGSEKRFTAWATAIAIWVIPIVLLVAPSLSKRALGEGYVKRAYCLVSVPLAIAVAPFALSALSIVRAQLRF
jgi:hypothetical protein